MKVRVLLTKSFEATTAAGLDAAFLAWVNLAASAEYEFHQALLSQLNGTTVVLTIVYTE